MPKNVRLVHPLTDVFDTSSPPALLMKREDIALPTKSAKCFSISNLLSHAECEKLINTSKRMGYANLAAEYPHKYRNSTRVIVRAPQLADLIYDRLKNFLQPSDIANAHPYGFNNAGVWKPIGLNDVLKFSCYEVNELFEPHYDGCFVVSNEIRSIFTLLIYLNDDYEGGETVFSKKQKGYGFKYGQEPVNKPERSQPITPKAATALIFNHDVLHSGGRVISGTKFVVKTEIIFRRVDWSSSFQNRVSFYDKDPLYEQAVKLYALSNQLEEKGDTASATSVYLKALDIQAKFKTFPKQPAKSDATVCFSTEILNEIFGYLNLQTIILCTEVSRRWCHTARDGIIWFRLFKDNFPSHFQLENRLHSIQTEEKAFLRDWYSIFKLHHLRKKFSYPTICLDIGGCYFKYGMPEQTKPPTFVYPSFYGLPETTKVQKKTYTFREPTFVGLERHAHFMIQGGGLADAWKAGKKTQESFYVQPIHRPFTRGKVADWDAMWVLIHHICTSLQKENLIGENPLLHPVLFAEGVIPFDRDSLYHLMFELLEVPSVCIVDSALLAMHAIGRTTGMVIDCGKEEIVCTPVWQGKILKENRKTCPVAGRLMGKYFNSLLRFPEKGQQRKYIAIDRECKVALDPQELVVPEGPPPPRQWDRTATCKENIRAPELLFNFRLLPSDKLYYPTDDLETNSVVDFVYETVVACDPSLQKELFNCLLLCGGLAEMPGFVQRFEREMNSKRNESTVISQPQPSFTVLNGAIAFSSSALCSAMSINRVDYLNSPARKDTKFGGKIAETTVLGELLAKMQNK